AAAAEARGGRGAGGEGTATGGGACECANAADRIQGEARAERAAGANRVARGRETASVRADGLPELLHVAGRRDRGGEAATGGRRGGAARGVRALGGAGDAGDGQRGRSPPVSEK